MSRWSLVGALLAVLVPSLALAQQAPPPPPPSGYPPPPPPPGYPPPPAYNGPGYYGYYGAPPPPPPGPQRDGLIIGFGIGGGSFKPADCDECDGLEGGAFEFHVGGMITPNLGLLFDAFGVAHSDDGYTLSNSHFVAALQWWPNEQSRLWLKGGVGFARLELSDDYGDDALAEDEGGAALFAVGVEALQRRHFAMDIQLRLAISDYDEGDDNSIATAALLLGFNWF